MYNVDGAGLVTKRKYHPNQMKLNVPWEHIILIYDRLSMEPSLLNTHLVDSHAK